MPERLTIPASVALHDGVLKPLNFVAVLMLASVAAVVPADAQVMQIGDDGTVLTRANSGEVRWIDPRQPIVVDGATVPDRLVTPVMAQAGPQNWQVAMQTTAQKYGLSPVLLEALVWQESRWNAAALSPKGARGLTQLMPGTALEMGVNADDPVQNLEGGARYLRIQLNRFNGDLERALAAYNAGPHRVIRAGGVPAIAETQAYVAAILGRLAQSMIQPANR